MIDAEVRIAAFDWLKHRVEEQGDVLPRTLLTQGFQFHGIWVALIGPQGIFKPKILPSIPLSITTTPTGPYDDSFGNDGLLAYRYRGTDPNHRDNIGLREAMRSQTPLAYFHGITPGRYLAAWPVFVVGDNPEALMYTLLFMSEKRGGNWVTLFGGMDFDKSSGLEPELDGDPPG